MPEIADRITRHLAEIDKVTILDMGGSNGNGNGSNSINRFLASATGAMKQTFEVVRDTTGIDIESASRRVVENLGNGKGNGQHAAAPTVLEDVQPDEKE